MQKSTVYINPIYIQSTTKIWAKSTIYICHFDPNLQYKPKNGEIYSLH